MIQCGQKSKQEIFNTLNHSNDFKLKMIISYQADIVHFYRFKLIYNIILLNWGSDLQLWTLIFLSYVHYCGDSTSILCSMQHRTHNWCILKDELIRSPN